MKKKAVIIILGGLLLVTFFFSLFTLDEREQAVITQFGKAVRIVKQAGLHFKLPFIQEVITFDRWILEYDAEPTEVYTKDKKSIVIDNFAKWRINDPLEFLKSVRSVHEAQSRLDDIIYSELRAEVSKNTLEEVIREKRSAIMEAITQKSNEKALRYGMEIVDVRIKRADLPPENEQHVFERMRAEREREAKRYRSEGEEKALEIKAEADKEVVLIKASAYEEAEKIKGEGDREAIRIYGQVFARSPRFFTFLRTLEAYKKVFTKDTTVILSTESELFKYLKKE
jgi:membrane protease subunit HflC